MSAWDISCVDTADAPPSMNDSSLCEITQLSATSLHDRSRRLLRASRALLAQAQAGYSPVSPLGTHVPRGRVLYQHSGASDADPGSVVDITGAGRRRRKGLIGPAPSAGQGRSPVFMACYRPGVRSGDARGTLRVGVLSCRLISHAWTLSTTWISPHLTASPDYETE